MTELKEFNQNTERDEFRNMYLAELYFNSYKKYINNQQPRNKVDLFVKKSHYPAYLPANNMTSKMDEANAGLISKQQQQQQPRVKTRPPPGKCTLARKRLRQVFNMRKYYLSIIGLTGFEAVLVLCRVILETESLRFPPGNSQRMILDAQLALECFSLFTLTLFVVEVPFKMWAMGIRQWGRQLLFLIDALVCIVCFSLDIYNIYRHAINPSRITSESVKVIDLCNYIHLTLQANTASTFAEISGLIIVYRLWYIKRYIKKAVLAKNRQSVQQIHDLQQVLEEGEYRISQLESLLQNRKDYPRYPSNLMPNNNNRQGQPNAISQAARPSSKVTYSSRQSHRTLSSIDR